jgi:type IV pilus assembly protein PilO
MRRPIDTSKLRPVNDVTETRKWLLGAVAVAVAVALGGWFLLVAPKRAEVADLQSQTTTQEQSNDQGRTQLEVLKQQNKDLPQKQAELAALREKIPATENLPAYIHELLTIASNSDVTLTDMAPAAAVTVGTAPSLTGAPLTSGELAAVNVDFTLSGQYEGIQKFMNDLENADRYTLVSGLTIEEDEESDTGALTATVNGRIFVTPTIDPATNAVTIPGAAPAVSATPSPTPAP